MGSGQGQFAAWLDCQLLLMQLDAHHCFKTEHEYGTLVQSCKQGLIGIIQVD